MINVPTVFVLGAGASMPCGFPSGSKLREYICMRTSGNSNTDLSNAFREKFSIGREELRNFGDAFLRSKVGTIDDFLGRNEHFSPIGKLAIAYSLCACENPDEVRRLDNDDDWYAALWKIMIDGVVSPDGLAGNQVRFVSFNYDRSLELFLHDATKHTFSVGDADAFKAWRKLGIIHVYGLMGEFHYMPQPNARQYIADLSTQSLNTAASGIDIIPEVRDDSPKFAQVRTLLDWAERICFLGFGFDSLNVKRLGLKDVAAVRETRDKGQRPPMIYASVLDKTRIEISSINQQLGGPLIQWHSFDLKNLMMLRNSPILLP